MVRGHRKIVFMPIRMAVHRYAAAWLLLLETLAETQTDVLNLLKLMLKAINQKSIKLFFLKKYSIHFLIYSVWNTKYICMIFLKWA